MNAQASRTIEEIEADIEQVEDKIKKDIYAHIKQGISPELRKDIEDGIKLRTDRDNESAERANKEQKKDKEGNVITRELKDEKVEIANFYRDVALKAYYIKLVRGPYGGEQITGIDADDEGKGIALANDKTQERLRHLMEELAQAKGTTKRDPRQRIFEIVERQEGGALLAMQAALRASGGDKKKLLELIKELE